jgi:class 3 adenylate cyclase
MALAMNADEAGRTATLTFVLGDMVGSSRLWEERPELMPGVLARLDDLVTDHLTAAGGHRPAEQGEGDNFVVAFDQPLDAARGAAALQAALCDEAWPDGLDVTVRMAVHTGEVGLRDGGRATPVGSSAAPRYMGDTLNRCARLRGLGHGGQVLVSSATAALVVDGLGPGLFLRDLGAHHLRDLSQPERVSQLCGPGLPFEFPSLRSLDRARTNLPVQMTSFIGRATELTATTRLLEERRLVTLAGAGGCGKTRLAVQSAAEVLDRFPDGVWFTDLAPITDPDQIPRALAAAAGINELPGRPLLESLLDHFAGAEALLVLDNCEHLLDDAGALAETLLRANPGIRVLATSREPLGADGETTYRVPSLGLPGAAHDIRCESVALFTDRAGLARPTMRLGPDELAAAVEICVRLDGIPLAIELAAARCRAMTPRQIADRLAAHFDLLTGGSRRALPRHRALEASIEWSYQLLDEGDRALLHRLAVFAGGFTLPAAESVGVADLEDS